MTATRLLVLGVVRGFGHAHGYLVRTQLLAWGAEHWANIKWGSLYHALRKLADEDLLIATEDARCRIDYEITARGEAEFYRLLRTALREPEPRPDMLAAGLSLMPALPRAEAIELFQARVQILRATRAEIPRVPSGQPRHMGELSSLWAQACDDDLAWTLRMIDRLASGMYVMADDEGALFGIAGAWPQTGTQGLQDPRTPSPSTVNSPKPGTITAPG